VLKATWKATPTKHCLFRKDYM